MQAKLVAVVLASMVDVAIAQSCTTAELMEAEAIVNTCCEGIEGGCVETFPTTCGHTCAELVVPYFDNCGTMLGVMGDALFSSFAVTAFLAFKDACRQTLVLYQKGVEAGSCIEAAGEPSPALKARIDAVNRACCEQDSVNTCTSGAPQTCEAECALEFLPYWKQCLNERSAIGGEMNQFTKLFTACTDDLPESEKLNLYEDVTSLDDSPECDIDITMVISRGEAKARDIKPTCETDAFPICNQMINAGMKSCKVDYCEICPEAHSCDHECGLPCAGGEDTWAGGGHRRFLRFLAEIEQWTSQLGSMTLSCPLDTLQDRLKEVDELCCDGSGSCVDGVPTQCPYRCGRAWTEFYTGCQSVLSMFFEDVDQLHTLSDRCLDIDPLSITMALHTASCEVCGDGEMKGNEECDDGDGNSNSPGASCRENCRRPYCGDGVVDGEACDLGPLNSDSPGSACSLDCATLACHRGLFFEGYVSPEGFDFATLASVQDSVSADVWNGWTPTVEHKEHEQALWYSNDQSFVDEIEGFEAVDNFVMRWRGDITIPETGDYTFQTNSDDGSMLYIDEQLVVNNDGLHGTKAAQGTVTLTAGGHTIVVAFFENGGLATMEASWSLAGGELQPLSYEVLSNGFGC
jgi:hypothetical protein